MTESIITIHLLSLFGRPGISCVCFVRSHVLLLPRYVEVKVFEITLHFSMNFALIIFFLSCQVCVSVKVLSRTWTCELM